VTFPTKNGAVRADPQGDLPPRMSSSSDLHPVRSFHARLFHGRNWRWAWLIISVLVSSESFFVRQLLSALLLFTVVFVIAAVLIALFIGIDYGADSSVSWAVTQMRSIHFSMHHSVALPLDFRQAGQTVRYGDSRGSVTIDTLAKQEVDTGATAHVIETNELG
jgi:hypothetical protein